VGEKKSLGQCDLSFQVAFGSWAMKVPVFTLRGGEGEWLLASYDCTL